MATTNDEQSYGPTSGVVTGWIGLVGCGLLALVLLVTAHDLVSVRWALGLGALAVVIWSYMLRPRIILTASEVELRNPWSSWWLPLAAIDLVTVRVVTRVEIGADRYDAVAVGRRVRAMVRPGDPKSETLHDAPGLPDLVVDQILTAAERARTRGAGPQPVRRTWAVRELALLALLVVALGIALLF